MLVEHALIVATLTLAAAAPAPPAGKDFTTAQANPKRALED